jgi:hypothetical protein
MEVKNMLYNNQSVKKVETKELERRLNFLKRNKINYDQLGIVNLSFMRRQEMAIIEEELKRRAA